MISTLILGILVELIGAIGLTYNFSNENQFWGFCGLIVMVLGLTLMYSAFRPVIL